MKRMRNCGVPHLDRDGDVWLLNIGNDENRLTTQWLADIHTLLDEVAATPPPVALVTMAEGKFFSNGLDLDWLTTHLDEAAGYIDSVHSLLVKLTILPMPTIAAIQGHCFAAGAMLAIAHDWRVMRADRGFFCLPEVDIGLPFSPGMDALLRAKLPVATALEAMTTGNRYGGTAAAAAGLVTTAVAEDDVLPHAVERARELAGKAGPTLGTIKARMFADVVELLSQGSPDTVSS
ncbi:MAG TPA: enoyl-CoA hydratase-related protein [Mycobacteriales bacterium]|nr:enoyl-CoA hydratase-related protein [Mycobacteriales bacterium]